MKPQKFKNLAAAYKWFEENGYKCTSETKDGSWLYVSPENYLWYLRVQAKGVALVRVKVTS